MNEPARDRALLVKADASESGVQRTPRQIVDEGMTDEQISRFAGRVCSWYPLRFLARMLSAAVAAGNSQRAAELATKVIERQQESMVHDHDTAAALASELGRFKELKRREVE